MKGFLSLLGITLIVGAFGLILLSFYGNPLEEVRSQERMYAYSETRQNHSTDEGSSLQKMAAPAHELALSESVSYIDLENSCKRTP